MFICLEYKFTGGGGGYENLLYLKGGGGPWKNILKEWGAMKNLPQV
jgi:hypothetical protein